MQIALRSASGSGCQVLTGTVVVSQNAGKKDVDRITSCNSPAVQLLGHLRLRLSGGATLAGSARFSFGDVGNSLRVHRGASSVRCCG